MQPEKPAGCTSIRKGNLYGRNFDWVFDEGAEFVVKTTRRDDKWASIGVASAVAGLTDAFVQSGVYNEAYRILPFKLEDGINEHGVVANINVVPLDKGTTIGTTPTGTVEAEVCTSMLVRYILDKFQTAKEAGEYIRDYVTVYTPKYLDEQDYECHFMVGDKEHTYIMEIINGTVTYREYNIMTNYYLDGVTFNEDNTLYSIIDTPEHTPSVDNGLSMYSSGVERHNILAAFEGSMRERMNVILYTQTYTGEEGADFWYSEYTGLGLGIDNTVAEYEENGRIGRIKEQYINRTRDDRNTWQTTHSSVYNLKDLTLNIVVQEDTEHEYNYSLEN